MHQLNKQTLININIECLLHFVFGKLNECAHKWNAHHHQHNWRETKYLHCNKLFGFETFAIIIMGQWAPLIYWFEWSTQSGQSPNYFQFTDIRHSSAIVSHWPPPLHSMLMLNANPVIGFRSNNRFNSFSKYHFSPPKCSFRLFMHFVQR